MFYFPHLLIQSAHIRPLTDKLDSRSLDRHHQSFEKRTDSSASLEEHNVDIKRQKEVRYLFYLFPANNYSNTGALQFSTVIICLIRIVVL